MSLLSKKNLFASLDNPDADTSAHNKKTSKRRKKTQQPKRFKIADSDSEIEPPVLRKTNSDASSTGIFSFLSSSTSDLFDSPEALLNPTADTTTSTTTNRKLVEEALSSSKLSSITADGPIEVSPPLGKRRLKAAKKHAKSLTKGSKWFDMAKMEITKERKNDLEALKLRSAMDGIHHYKRNHMTHTPKYFHVGTVVETSADFYSSRLTKKQRKKTLADEFAAEFERR